MHFYIEHNFGHHVSWNSKEENSKIQAKRLFFWITSVSKQYVDAWKMQQLLKGRKIISSQQKTICSGTTLFNSLFINGVVFIFY